LNDHPPAHVHVFKGDGAAQITLEPVRIDKVWSMKPADVARAKAPVTHHRGTLSEPWKGASWPIECSIVSIGGRWNGPPPPTRWNRVHGLPDSIAVPVV